MKRKIKIKEKQSEKFFCCGVVWSRFDTIIIANWDFFLRFQFEDKKSENEPCAKRLAIYRG